MKAARYYGPGDIRVEQIPEPVAGKGQVKVKIAWNGICGSDLHAFLAQIPKYASTTPNEITGETLPVTLGHEFSGTIVGLGEDVDQGKWNVGKNVVIEPIITCMKTSTCHSCASGSRNMCSETNFIGICGWGGGLAEYIAVDVRYVHILPNNVPLDVGACVEPLAVAWHAVKRSGIVKGQSALVLGAGPIGIFLVKVLRAFDPSATVIISEPTVLRRQQALKHGATQAVDPINTKLLDVVKQATGGLGVDIAFDAAGVQATIDAAIASVRPRGTVVNVALWEKNASIDMNTVLIKEIILTGTLAYDRVHEELIEALAAGKIKDVESLITSRVAIEDVVEKGFKALLNDKDAQVKILIHP